MNKDNRFINRIWLFIKNNLQWLGFVLLIVVLIFAFITVLIEPKETLLDIIYGLVFISLLLGMIYAFNKEKEEYKKISFRSYDGLMVIIGVFATYSLVHFLGISVVIASSSIGLLGFIFIRKHEIPIYCGSFAGMVSIVLFSFLEVAILSIICAFIYTLTKPIFKGFGGKLGTIAFMSSLIVHSIFNDEYLIISIDINIWLIFLTTISGVLITFYFQHKFNTSAVLSSAGFSLIFGLLVFLISSEHMDYLVVFFSASFIGMSSKEKLPSIWYVLLAGIILGLIYDVFFEFFNGLGGKLGLMAMLSVIVTSGVSVFIKKSIKKRIDQVDSTVIK